jgi:hypothetical protein
MVVKWPQGVRMAVMWTFDFDAESSWLARDAENAGRLGVRIALLRRFMEYTRTFEGLWYATGTEVAEAFVAQEHANQPAMTR